MPPRAEPLPPDARRAAILDAARPLLFSHGPNLTTRQVAEAAGIAEGTVFRAFATKDELIEALIDHAMDPATSVTELAGIDPALPLEERLRLVIVGLRGRIRELSALFGVVMSRQCAGNGAPKPRRPDPEVERERADRLRDAVVAVIGRDADRLSVAPDTAASYLRSIAFATSHPFLSDGFLDDPDEIVQMTLHGLLKESSC